MSNEIAIFDALILRERHIDGPHYTLGSVDVASVGLIFCWIIVSREDKASESCSTNAIRLIEDKTNGAIQLSINTTKRAGQNRNLS